MIRLAAVLAFFAAPLAAETILSAEYDGPTDRYAHGVLGDAIEWSQLRITSEGRVGLGGLELPIPRRVVREVTLGPDRVFEDIAPRLADIDGDGSPEVIVVEAQVDTGAQLAIYDETGKIAATPHIGTRNRWLAPIGAADLDGDGFVEIAYIDRPHLAKTLRVWRYKDGDFTEIAAASGLSNHRIGEDFISGGVRDCGQGPEMITASANWTRIMATRLENGSLRAQDIGPFAGRDSFTQALACQAVR
ncbi:VCBS repeat-containing protein [Cognatiyoonia sp. IB215446]|uniref:FG-GAP repeat domain-containing protein n=1 Tax=Cognatiyoonia sp. IB215446 TaxID=3097355 RepID=UPI002A0E37D6|nr:VCBS repeat-containing protein [Cognatiyoonia sp. IB215446]MDX8348297.1 VCBS repeat-containing protein [Cognatiyoonia sp. IB215446]